jgi:cell division protein FtsA
MPCRRGAPKGVGGRVDVVKSPEYATGVGLVKFGARGDGAGLRPAAPPPDRGVWRRVRGWLGEMF